MRELPSFEWGNRSDDGVKRVKRPILMLENGAKYEGEWYLLSSSNSCPIGSKILMSEMERVFRSGLTAQDMRVTGRTTKLTAEAD
jgi:hypothetical protein